jgi:predicted dithiol-disulfide oxidoreductase (DUF899 family)
MTMNDTQTELQRLEAELIALKQRIAELRRGQPEPVEDFVLQGSEGDVRLSELFDARGDLLVLHNMGKSCSWCTLWADGMNGQLPQILTRAPFVLVSPDPVPVQQELAQERGWKFQMLSDPGPGAFTRAMGMYVEGEGYWPGVSGFRRRDDGRIERIAHTSLGPGDDFCPAWPLFDLLESGADGWEPKNAL